MPYASFISQFWLATRSSCMGCSLCVLPTVSTRAHTHTHPIHCKELVRKRVMLISILGFGLCFCQVRGWTVHLCLFVGGDHAGENLLVPSGQFLCTHLYKKSQGRLHASIILHRQQACS